MRNTLRESITENTSGDHARFYVPGHKGVKDLAGGIAREDVTELYFTDDLNHPSSHIQRAEKDASELFGSRFTLFSVNGSSAAVMASVMSCAREGYAVLLPSDSHLSCYYGALHARAKVKRLYIADPVRGLQIGELEEYLSRTDEPISCCVITSPTYCGCCADLDRIIPILHGRGIRVIADESHGTHLLFTSSADRSAVRHGADYVVHSAHKTMGALTQTAMLHVNDPDADENAVRFFMRSLQSTSPSFPLICSVMDSVERLKTDRGLFEDKEVWYNEMLETSKNFRNLEMLSFGGRRDPLKITVRFHTKAEDLTRILREEKVDEEMILGDLAVFSMGIGTTGKDIDQLKKALARADAPEGTDLPRAPLALPETPCVTDMARALSLPAEYVPLKDCEGRISADMVNVYPPGSPVLIPGSLVTADVIGYIEGAGSVNGIYDGALRVIISGETL